MLLSSCSVSGFASGFFSHQACLSLHIWFTDVQRMLRGSSLSWASTGLIDDLRNDQINSLTFWIKFSIDIAPLIREALGIIYSTKWKCCSPPLPPCQGYGLTSAPAVVTLRVLTLWKLFPCRGVHGHNSHIAWWSARLIALYAGRGLSIHLHVGYLSCCSISTMFGIRAVLVQWACKPGAAKVWICQ